MRFSLIAPSLLVPLLALLIGCSAPSSRPSGGFAAQPTANVSAQPSIGFGGDPSEFSSLALDGTAFASTAELAAAAAASGVTCSSDAPASTATHERATCSLEGDDVVIRVFGDSAARNGYLASAIEILDKAQADAVPLLVGPTWVIAADTPATLETIRQTIGGELLE